MNIDLIRAGLEQVKIQALSEAIGVSRETLYRIKDNPVHARNAKYETLERIENKLKEAGILT